MFLLIISFIPLQNSFIKKFSGNLVLNNLDDKKVYDIIILGSNSYRRIDVALDIVDNLIIENLIFINIKNNNKIYEKIENLFPKQKIIKTKESTSTYEDFLIVKNHLIILNENLIVISDDFHIPRVKKLFNKLEKNILYFPVINIVEVSDYNYFSFNRGIVYTSSILKEVFAYIYYIIYDYI